MLYFQYQTYLMHYLPPITKQKELIELEIEKKIALCPFYKWCPLLASVYSNYKGPALRFYSMSDAVASYK